MQPQVGNFFGDLFSNLAQDALNTAGTAIQNFVQQHTVPQPVSNNVYDLNQYSNDLREQSPAYQQYKVQRMQQQEQEKKYLIIGGAALALLLLI